MRTTTIGVKVVIWLDLFTLFSTTSSH